MLSAAVVPLLLTPSLATCSTLPPKHTYTDAMPELHEYFVFPYYSLFLLTPPPPEEEMIICMKKNFLYFANYLLSDCVELD